MPPNIVNTRILDHIVHLTPPGTVEEVSRQFEKLGFRVLPGGTHADGLTANALVALADGVYLELLSFTHPASHYPPSSPSRQRRDAHPWAGKTPGWIDFAFLGTGSTEPAKSITIKINERGKREGSGVRYGPEQEGGRTRVDGEVLKWLISSPESEERGLLPFFCGDVTPRERRVPSNPPSNRNHPSGAKGIAFVRALVPENSFDRVSKEFTSVIGTQPMSASSHAAKWALDTPQSLNAANPTNSHHGVVLILGVPSTSEELSFIQNTDTGSGIFEVGFRVPKGTKNGSETTPFGRIVWVPEESD